MSKLLQARIGVGGRFVADAWLEFAADADLATLAGSAGILVSYADWIERRALLLTLERPLGVRVGGADDLDALAPDLSRLALVAVDFPAFTDGRGYSVARLLRERYGYLGELRAVGDVLRDQVFYLLRCGFDSLALREDQDESGALAALTDFREVYQAAIDRPTPLYQRRAAALAALAAAPTSTEIA
jgi:uncharacterized protein (DUF934 family)